MNQLTEKFPVTVIKYQEVHSTNTILAEMCNAETLLEFTTVTAAYQTAGRGQRGNVWESEDGKNLLFSTVMYPSFLEPRQQFRLSEICALAVRDTLLRYVGDVTVKWPNDIYWHDKKICGMLLENDLSGGRIARCIAGIGINVNQNKFVGGAPNPISLKQITGKEYDISQILSEIMFALLQYYGLLQDGKMIEVDNMYAASLFRREGYHTYKDASGEFQACIKKIEPDGRLLLQDIQGRLRSYWFKEVEFKLF